MPRDLRDIAYIIERLTVDDSALWNDTELMEHFANGLLFQEDVSLWQLGRALRSEFSTQTLHVFVHALIGLSQEAGTYRACLVSDLNAPDARLEQADRIIRVVRLAVG